MLKLSIYFKLTVSNRIFEKVESTNNLELIKAIQIIKRWNIAIGLVAIPILTIASAFNLYTLEKIYLLVSYLIGMIFVQYLLANIFLKKYFMIVYCYLPENKKTHLH